MKSIPFLFVVGLIAGGCATDDPQGTPDVGADTGLATPDAGNLEDFGGATPDAATQADANPADSSMESPDASDVEDAHDADSDATEDLGMPDTGDIEGSGETCDEAIEVTVGGTFVGDTTTAANDYDASFAGDNCPSGAASGPDIVYALAPAADTTYDITVTPDGTFDPFLHVKSDCAIADCIDGTVFNGPGTKESLELFVPDGTTYFVIVDGELGSSGSYTLEVAIQ